MPHEKNILSIDELNYLAINHIIKKSFYYKKKKTTSKFNKKIIGNLFFEPSTRTCCSFKAAIFKGGGMVIEYNPENSSTKKGETLEDTIKTMEQYCNALIIRHPEKGIVERCAEQVNIPVINAGDGNGEHPSQALLDFFTILHYFHLPGKIAITFCGDLKNSRTSHSLIKLLDKMNHEITFYFVSDDRLRLDDDFVKTIKNMCIFSCDLTNVIEKTDVLYMIRLQKERFEDPAIKIDSMVLTPEILSKGKKAMIVLHALPRNEELPKECDTDPRCKYFEQMKNGVYVRMALLDYCLLPKKKFWFM